MYEVLARSRTKRLITIRTELSINCLMQLVGNTALSFASNVGVSARSHVHTERCGVLRADCREDGDLQLLGSEHVGRVTLAAESSLNHRDVHLRRSHQIVAPDSMLMNVTGIVRRY